MSRDETNAIVSLANTVSGLIEIVDKHTEALKVIAATLASIQQTVRSIQEPKP